MRFLALLGMTLALTLACGNSDGARTIDVQVDGRVLTLELVRTAEERSQGLSGRDVLATDAGMFFDLGSERIPSFWMNDMRLPLDMIWIDSDKRIVHVTRDVQPEPGIADSALRRYSPPQAVRYAIELNAGAATRLGLDVGDALRFELE